MTADYIGCTVPAQALARIVSDYLEENDLSDELLIRLGTSGLLASPPEPASPAPSGVGDEMALALLEANEGLGEAQCRIAVAAGLPRSSPADAIVARVKVLAAAQPVPTVSDTAAVLAGLVEEMRKFIGGDRSWGIYDAIALVEAAQRRLEGTER